MIRKFNYTGRKKIDKKDVKVRLIKDKSPVPSFDIRLNINPSDYPIDPELNIEAYDSTSLMRFRCGTLQNQKLPADRHLYNIHSTNGILFRVKLVDPTGEHGKILSMADRLATTGEKSEDTKRESLLTVSFMDLEDRIWRLDFPSTGPVLIINDRLNETGITDIIQNNEVFFSTIYPSVLREILIQILLFEDEYEKDDPTTWQNRWLKFIEQLPDVPRITDRRDYENSDHFKKKESFIDWIDLDAIPAFCRKYAVKTKFEAGFKTEVRK